MKVKKKKCEHDYVVEAIGGFPGHEHIHPVGPPVCKKCGDVKTVSALADTHSKRLHDAFDQMLFNKDEDGEGT